MISPVGDARAARRDSCRSIRASRPIASVSGSNSTIKRPSRMASPDRSWRVTDSPDDAAAFVEYEVGDLKHAAQTLRQIGGRRDMIGDASIANLGLAANDTLSNRRWRRQERPGDLLGRQPADLAQRERDLRALRQRRMAAGENQAQAIIFDIL